MNKRNILLALSGLGLAFSAITNAAPNVSEIDADTLRVVHYDGKPPFERRIIHRSNNPELFARYAPMAENAPRVFITAERSGGAPGKNLPNFVQRVSTDPQEIAEFARFEESSEANRNTRRWRGAPGKARAISQ